MPRRAALSDLEWAQLLAVPTDDEELLRECTFTPAELELIQLRRGDANRLGFAVQLAYMRYPGIALRADEPEPQVLAVVSSQLGIPTRVWAEYGVRAETRWEHRAELQKLLGIRAYTDEVHDELSDALVDVAVDTDKPLTVAEEAVRLLRGWGVLLPSPARLDEAVATALTRGNWRVYDALSGVLSRDHRRALDGLFARYSDGTGTVLGWLRQSPLKPNSKQVREHLRRLEAWRALELPDTIRTTVRHSRLVKIAREGGKMTVGDLGKLEANRRHATLAAVAVESQATVTDEVIELHDRIMGKAFNDAKKQYLGSFADTGKDINDKMLLLTRLGDLLATAREEGADPFHAIDQAIGWDVLQQSVAEAKALARPSEFDSLTRVRDSYPKLRRYTPEFLYVLSFRAAPAAEPLMEAVEVLRRLNRTKTRTIPPDTPLTFVPPRWMKPVRTEAGIDRDYYELCVLAELRNALRSGDLWVTGSRQYQDFDGYLLPATQYARLAETGLPLPVETNADDYLTRQLAELTALLVDVDAHVGAGTLPGVTLTAPTGLHVTPLEATVPAEAAALITRTAAMLPHLPITDLLSEVNAWTGFAEELTHLKTGETARDTTLLLTVVLADGINLGLSKMAEACTGATYAKMQRLQAMHIRDDTYRAALARIVNAQHRQPIAAHWGDGTTSSSDGQRFRVGDTATSTGHINPKYGSAPGRLIYTHVSDQYSPFYSQLVNVGARDATYVVDGLLDHGTDLNIREHHADTAGYTDHVFALTHLLGFQFAPRIRDLGDTRLYTPPGTATPNLAPMLGTTLNVELIRTHWDEILRLATSIKTATVSASLMLRKLGAYPRQNNLARALRELGRLHRTRYTLTWLQNPDLRQRTTAGLNKGEARHALARAVFFNRTGEIRDRSYEHQRYRASGLNLLTAAISFWNTVYLDRATTHLAHTGELDEALLRHLSPLGWDHINLTGNYTWKPPVKPGRYRPLRPTSG